jgi:serine/threonine protein kinase
LVQPAQPDSVASGSNYGAAPSAAHGISSAAFSQNYFKRFFVEEGELGRGGKGVVLLVKHVLDGVSLGHYACKRVPVGDDHEWLKKVLIEVQLLQHLSHQNLVSYRHVWLEDIKLNNFGPSVPCAFILQQYCNAGDLHKYICGSSQTATTTQQLKERMRRKSKGQPEPATSVGGPRKLQFDTIYSFFKDITSGLRFLHVNGYIHRDLKPSNCLLHETGRELRVLVSDFGEVQSENTVRKSTGSTGTISYCAPEVLRRLTPDGPYGNFTFKSDVFSLGMILYFLCFAQLPYRNADVVDEDREDLDLLRVEISQWAGFDDARRMRPELPEKLYSFLTRLLSVDPDKRPTADEVLSGIQAGVGSNESRRFHRNGAPATDIRSGSLVLSVDAPPSSSPSPLSQRSPSMGVTHMPGFSGGMVPALPTAGYGTDTPESGHDLDLTHNDRESRTPDHHDLVLRSARSPTLETHPQPGHRQFFPRLLPPPPPNRFFFHTLIRHGSAVTVVSFGLLLVKVLSVTQPCSPLAVNAWIFYPLLILAALDFGVTNFWAHLGALALHFFVVGYALKQGYLCVWDRGSLGTIGGMQNECLWSHSK